MRIVALFGIKGGVGKSTLAVNLAWSAVTVSARTTLLWDLDPQGAASAMLGATPPPRRVRKAIGDGDPASLVKPTALPGLSIIAADTSLRGLDLHLAAEDKSRRLARLIDRLPPHDRIILDCPPGLTVLAERVFRAVDLLVAPVPAAPLGERTLEQLRQHLATLKRPPALLPVFNMVDRRRVLHRQALLGHPDRSVVPQSAAFELVGGPPMVARQPGTPAARAVRQLWTAIEHRLAGRGETSSSLGATTP